MNLKFTEASCVMKMKNDAKFEEELTGPFKIYMTNFTNFDPSTQKLQNICTLMTCCFMGSTYSGVGFDGTVD